MTPLRPIGPALVGSGRMGQAHACVSVQAALLRRDRSRTRQDVVSLRME